MTASRASDVPIVLADDLPVVVAARLGEEGAAQTRLLRGRLAQAGIRVPRWIDERPGRLRVVIGDLSGDPPLGQTARTMGLIYGEYLMTGLGALALAVAAPRMAVVTREAAVQQAVARVVGEGSIEVLRTPPMWPSQPDLDVPGAAGRAWVVGTRLLDRAAAALLGEPPRRLCTVAGAVANPGVLSLSPGETPADLVARRGGATPAAWVAIAGGAPGGRLCDPEEPLPEDEEMLLILPAAHELVRRLRRPLAEWLPSAASICSGCQLCTEGCPEALRGHPISPHVLVLAAAGMQGAGMQESAAMQAAARWCTGCGACDVICPAGLLPSQGVLSFLARGQAPDHRAHRVRQADGLPGHPGDAAARRRLPLHQVTTQLGLLSY